MKTINNTIQEDYVDFDNKTLLHKTGFRFPEGLDGHRVINSLAEAKFNKGEVDRVDITIQLAVKWILINFDINIEANYLSNIQKYRWLAKPRSIIPKSFKTSKEYAIAVDKYYGKESFNSPQEAYQQAIKYCLTELIK